eukprot:248439-Lingulodinium_polyedra.AAC.1
MHNPSGIYKKSILIQGFEQWQQLHGSFLTKNKPPNYLRDQVYAVQQMLLNVKDTSRTLRTGKRVPAWLRDLCSLLVCERGPEELQSDDEDEDFMEQSKPVHITGLEKRKA